MKSFHRFGGIKSLTPLLHYLSLSVPIPKSSPFLPICNLSTGLLHAHVMPQNSMAVTNITVTNSVGSWALYSVQVTRRCAYSQSLLVMLTSLSLNAPGFNFLPLDLCSLCLLPEKLSPFSTFPPADPYYLILSIFFCLLKFSSNRSSLQLCSCLPYLSSYSWVSTYLIQSSLSESFSNCTFLL